MEPVGILYLKEAKKDEANKEIETARGFFYGEMSCMVFPCVLGGEGKAHWVFFIVDTGAPLTFISIQASVHTDIKDS